METCNLAILAVFAYCLVQLERFISARCVINQISVCVRYSCPQYIGLIITVRLCLYEQQICLFLNGKIAVYILELVVLSSSPASLEGILTRLTEWLVVACNCSL